MHDRRRPSITKPDLVLLMLIPGSQILVYPILWLLMPSEEAVTAGWHPPPSR